MCSWQKEGRSLQLGGDREWREEKGDKGVTCRQAHVHARMGIQENRVSVRDSAHLI